MAKVIELNSREAQLRGLLLDAAKRIDDGQGSEGKPKEPTVLRWAGGWVRDKLLGIDSHDLDTAINNMTGEVFASQLCQICDLPEVRARHSIGPDDIGNLHKIPKNPDKSKHLETTTTRLFGLDLDFVNLRKETYTDDSRNPQMEFGTAEEDALRRDATVNALFYNLHTGQVEDFTGGLADMKAKLIRTPMEPLQTFMDDPLRVLRLVRFASRLQFSLDADTRKAMAHPRVLDALKLKISRERVGVEVEKMLKGDHPRDSLQLIDKVGLYHTIFTDPNRMDMPKPDTTNWNAAYECLHFLVENKRPGSIHDLLVSSKEESYFSWILAALAPWEQLPDPQPKKGKKPDGPLATTTGREGIKANNKLSDVITAAHNNRGSILKYRDLALALMRPVLSKEQRVSQRGHFGMAIRGYDARGGHWKLQVLYAILVDVMERTGKPPAVSEGERSAEVLDRDEVLLEWKLFLDYLQVIDVMEAPSIKRIIDGHQLARALGAKPGKWMAPALDIVMEWQLCHPDETDPAGAIEEVRKRKEKLGIP